eukprot:scaffold685_cov281-Pinguiococcus_pyrenoidosus.AAC.13
MKNIAEDFLGKEVRRPVGRPSPASERLILRVLCCTRSRGPSSPCRPTSTMRRGKRRRYDQIKFSRASKHGGEPVDGMRWNPGCRHHRWIARGARDQRANRCGNCLRSGQGPVWKLECGRGEDNPCL